MIKIAFLICLLQLACSQAEYKSNLPKETGGWHRIFDIEPISFPANFQLKIPQGAIIIPEPDLRMMFYVPNDFLGNWELWLVKGTQCNSAPLLAKSYTIKAATWVQLTGFASLKSGEFYSFCALHNGKLYARSFILQGVTWVNEVSGATGCDIEIYTSPSIDKNKFELSINGSKVMPNQLKIRDTGMGLLWLVQLPEGMIPDKIEFKTLHDQGVYHVSNCESWHLTGTGNKFEHFILVKSGLNSPLSYNKDQVFIAFSHHLFEYSIDNTN